MGGHQEENDQWPAVALKSRNVSVRLTMVTITLVPAFFLKNGGGLVKFMGKAVNFRQIIIHVINEGHSHIGNKVYVTY